MSLLLTFRFALLGQNKEIAGKVVDDEGQPLAGVTVIVEGQTTGTITGKDGTYALSDVSPTATLVFSFIGMHTQTVAVGDQASIDVQMETDAYGLSEVMVVGYGTHPPGFFDPLS